MKQVTKKSMVIAIIAGLLVLLDGIITQIFNQEFSFTWIAFVSWTVFFGETTKGRLKAIPGYVIGFFAATIIIKLGNLLSFMNIGEIALGAIVATMFINFICTEMEPLYTKIPVSVNGIFVGMTITFSGLGIGMGANDFRSSIFMISIILIYGILGLLCGWASIKFSAPNN